MYPHATATRRAARTSAALTCTTNARPGQRFAAVNQLRSRHSNSDSHSPDLRMKGPGHRWRRVEQRLARPKIGRRRNWPRPAAVAPLLPPSLTASLAPGPSQMAMVTSGKPKKSVRLTGSPRNARLRFMIHAHRVIRRAARGVRAQERARPGRWPIIPAPGFAVVEAPRRRRSVSPPPWLCSPDGQPSIHELLPPSSPAVGARYTLDIPPVPSSNSSQSRPIRPSSPSSVG